MDLQRFWRHCSSSQRRLRRVFAPEAMAAIEQAIRASESLHDGEICFAVEAVLDPWPLLQGQTARARAMALFAELGVWDTAANNGVLIYVLLADHAVEIVADRGISALAPETEWEAICRQMETQFAQGAYQEGALRGIAAVTQTLAKRYPARAGRGNELSNQPVQVL